MARPCIPGPTAPRRPASITKRVNKVVQLYWFGPTGPKGWLFLQVLAQIVQTKNLDIKTEKGPSWTASGTETSSTLTPRRRAGFRYAPGGVGLTLESSNKFNLSEGEGVVAGGAVGQVGAAQVQVAERGPPGSLGSRRLGGLGQDGRSDQGLHTHERDPGFFSTSLLID